MPRFGASAGKAEDQPKRGTPPSQQHSAFDQQFLCEQYMETPVRVYTKQLCQSGGFCLDELLHIRVARSFTCRNANVGRKLVVVL